MATGKSLPEQVRQALPASTEGVVAAVSGGPDSVALLRALIEVRREGSAAPLVIAHLNHQLRGAESDADESFVVELHARLCGLGAANLHCMTARLDVAGAARRAGDNLEATARRLRYEWLAEVARRHGLGRVASGHTADDQAETVLHRLLRGAGWQGLRGIAFERELAAGVRLIRPLLRVRREEVLAYLEALGQPYRRDSSNDDPRHMRNRIRHELLPLLARDYNPGITTVLGRLAELAGQTHRDEQEAAGALLSTAELPRAGGLLVFDRGRLAAASRYRVRSLFRLVWQREGWPLGDMSQAAWERLAQLVFTEARAVDLPGGIHARRRGRVVQVGPRRSEAL